MATSEDRVLENFSRGTEELIRDLELPVAAGATVLSPEMVEQIESSAAIPLESLSEPSVDGTAVVEVSGDGMEARAWFHPAVGSGGPLSLDTVRAVVESRGIASGVD